MGHGLQDFEGGFDVGRVPFADEFVGREEGADGQQDLFVVVLALAIEDSFRHVINFFIFSILFPKPCCHKFA